MRSFAQNIVALSENRLGEETLKLRQSITTDLISFLVNLVHGDISSEGSPKGLKKVLSALLDSVGKKLLSASQKDIILHQIIVQAHQVSPIILAKFSSRQLALMLVHNPVLKVTHAIQNQNQWTFAKSDPFLTTSFTQLLAALSMKEGSEILQEVLEQQEVNWQHAMIYIATLLICFQDAPAYIAGVITKQVTEALDRSQMDLLVSGFLIARQACLEGHHIFPSYPDWFTSTFGNEATSLANNKKSFVFLVKFLTDLVPFEPPLYLKAHIQRPPFVPAKCRSLWSDYLLLARTRLVDLKINIEEEGIYDSISGPDSGSNKGGSAVEDIERAIGAFDRTGKVPSTVMEASIFRKPYFVGKFLVALLEPRPLPDIQDQKMTFIAALNSAGKIPPTLMNSYEKGCQKMAAQLLEGLDFDEDSMESLLKTPKEQLTDSLQSLTQAVLSKTDVSRCISILSEKITAMLGNCDSGVSHSAQDVSGVDALMVSEAILNSICSTLGSLRDVQRDTSDLPSSWLTMLLAMTSQHVTVIHAFIDRLTQLITSQDPCLTDGHIYSLAAILVHLASFWTELKTPAHCLSRTHHSDKHSPTRLGRRLCCPQTTKALDGEDTEAMVRGRVSEMFAKLQCGTKSQMLFILKLCCAYLQYSFESFHGVNLHYMSDRKAVVSPQIILWMSYLAPRILPLCRQPSTGVPSGGESQVSGESSPMMSSTALIYNSHSFQSLMAENKLSVYEWALLEMQVDPTNDCLYSQERLVYYDWLVWQHFMSDPQQSSSPWHCARSLSHAVLDTEQRFRSPVNKCSSCVPTKTPLVATTNKPALINLIQMLVASGACVREPQPGFEMPPVPLIWSILLERLHLLSETQSTLTSDGLMEVDDMSAQLLALEEQGVDGQAEMDAWFRLCSVLPPYLLFCDGLGPGVQQNMFDWGHLINSIIRDYLTDGVVLDPHKTLFITQGLVRLSMYSIDKAVSKQLDHSPIIMTSIAYHWRLVSPILQRLVTTTSSGTDGTGITCLTRIIEQMETTNNTFDSILKKEKSADTIGKSYWLMGVLLYCKLCTRAGNEVVLERILSTLSESASSLQALHSLSTCLIGQLASSILSLNQQGLGETMNYIKLLWRIVPVTLTGMTCLMQQALPRRILLLMPVACLNVLTSMSEAEFLVASSTNEGLATMLGWYNQCCSLYEGDSDPLPLPPELLTFNQVITIDLLQSFTSKLQFISSKIPYQCLSSLSRELFSRCDPLIRRCLKL